MIDQMSRSTYATQVLGYISNAITGTSLNLCKAKCELFELDFKFLKLKNTTFRALQVCSYQEA